MQQSDVGVCLIFVRRLFVAAFVVRWIEPVETNANVVGPHVSLRKIVHGVAAFLLLARPERLAGAACALVVPARLTLKVLLEGDLLLVVLVPAPQSLEAILNGLPAVRPVEDLHLPGHVHVLVRFKDVFVLIVEGHLY